MTADLIVIIALAAFVVWKYRQVLGHKTGHDVENPKERLNQRREKAQGRVVQLKKYQETGELIEAEAVDVDKAFEAIDDKNIHKSLEKIKQADESFSLDEFLSGAGGAFEMVMEAFNTKDRAALKMLLSDEIYAEFDQEIKHHEKQKTQPHTTLVSILSTEVKNATLNKNTAQLSLVFLSEQIHIVKDKDGKVVEGDKSRIEQIEDEWVFERNLKSRNPNWMIVDM